MQVRKTHFEQVPVAAVKELTNLTDTGQPGKEAKAGMTAVKGNWRNLAVAIQTESDSEKMLELVREMIEMFDEEHGMQ